MAAKRSREELERDIYLLEQEELERVSPKLEILREPRRIKVVYGGRGAGAKTWGFASLLVQRAHREKIKILCTREVQLSIEESVHKIIKNTIERLRYPGWIIQKEHIYSPCGSYFTFRGMHDLRASEAIKGYEDFDVFWCEEAARLTDESWNVLIPTLRKPGSELWVNFNRVKEADPVYERFVKHQRDDSVVIKCEAGRIDNPWWTDELQREMEEDYKRDPALAEHTWGGEPQNQADNCVWDRASIRGAMARNVEAIGATELGVDVARFGKDNTDIYRRKGMKTVRHKEVHGYDTNEVADAVWDMADRDPSYAIKIDSGYNPGVIDVLRKKGAKVIEVGFGERASNQDLYETKADEMWFEFPMDEADIPDDPELMSQLSGRRYGYDKYSRKKIEPKDVYKKRNGGKSPDKADALLLCYAGNDILFDKSIRDGMAKRRQR